MFNAQAREGVGFAAPNMQGALEYVGAYWAAGNYKDSCWTDKARLAEALEEQISESFLSGKSYVRMARAIQDEFGVSFRKAERLVRTETSYAAGQSRKKAYQDIGWKTYDFITALDKRTCDDCGDLNTNQTLPLDKAEVGVNYPPVHPNCRCTIISEPPNSNTWRIGFDANEKRVKLPKDMTYPEWKAWQAAGCPEDVEAWRLQKSGANATIKARGSDEMNIRAPISSPIEQRNTGKGNPNAILLSGRPLNNRQRRLLERLSDYDARATFHKRDVNMRDLSALTAETGCDYAMFTKGGERLIVRGNEWMTNISPEDAREMAAEGWRWSGHTCPGEEINVRIASSGNKAILEFSSGNERYLGLSWQACRI